MMALTKSASHEARLPDGDDNDETPYLALMVRLVGVPSPESNWNRNNYLDEREWVLLQVKAPTYSNCKVPKVRGDTRVLNKPGKWETQPLYR